MGEIGYTSGVWMYFELAYTFTEKIARRKGVGGKNGWKLKETKSKKKNKETARG